MANVLLPIISGTLPDGICFPNEQARANAYASVFNAVLQGGDTGLLNVFNFGNTAPSPSRNIYPWLNSNDMRWYYFSGQWISPVNYDANERRLFVGDLTQLMTYDGGDTNSPSPTSGPMWQQDEAFIGRSPMGPGAIATSNPAKTLSVAELFGEGAHVLTVAELPDAPLKTNQNFMPVTLDINEGQEFSSGGSGARRQLIVQTGGSNSPHNTVHPVVGCYIIKPSGRLYRVAA